MNPGLASYLRRIFFLFRKELLALLKDPANRVVLIGPAIVQSLLFGYAGTYDLRHVPYAVLDQDRGAAAASLLARLDGTGVFVRTGTLAGTGEVARAIDSGEALLVLVIPPDFERRLGQAGQAPLQVILDGRNSATAGQAAGYVAAIVASQNRTRAGAMPPPITLDRRAWYNPNLESRWNLMPAMIGALSMLQTLLLAALSVAREREQGTFDQLLVTPLAPAQILIGKALPAICVGLLQSTLVLLVCLFWFEIPLQGSVALLYFGLFCFTVASVGLGLSISALSATMQQAMLYTFVLIMPLMLLSGLVAPVDNMPWILKVATYMNPLRFGVEIVRRIYLEGAGFGDIAVNFIPLAVMAAVTLPLAAWLFRHRLI